MGAVVDFHRPPNIALFRLRLDGHVNAVHAKHVTRRRTQGVVGRAVLTRAGIGRDDAERRKGHADAGWRSVEGRSTLMWRCVNPHAVVQSDSHCGSMSRCRQLNIRILIGRGQRRCGSKHEIQRRDATGNMAWQHQRSGGGGRQAALVGGSLVGGGHPLRVAQMRGRRRTDDDRQRSGEAAEKVGQVSNGRRLCVPADGRQAPARPVER